jgi:acetyl esterase/lipase
MPFRFALLVLALVPLVHNRSVLAAGVDCTIQNDIVYGHKDGLALTLDVVTPKENAKGIGIVLVSSGGWRSDKSNIQEENEKRLRGEHWTQGLLRGGYTLFIARHGTIGRYHVPDMVEDIRRAVRFARLHAAEYGVNPDRIGITSGSSGGHLSLMVALTGDDGQPDSPDPVARTSSRVQAVVAWFPPTDMINWNKENGYTEIDKIRPGLLKEMFGEVNNVEEQLRSISPIYFVSPDDPPLLLIHGDNDLVVPLQQSEVLRDRYDAEHLPVKLVVRPRGGHSYWPGIMENYQDVWAWFDQYLGK